MTNLFLNQNFQISRKLTKSLNLNSKVSTKLSSGSGRGVKGVEKSWQKLASLSNKKNASLSIRFMTGVMKRIEFNRLVTSGTLE